ncbi:MAG: YfhO family protein [Clostridia bacterium]|nr:YfhO family protein [Clostridia bacterium]
MQQPETKMTPLHTQPKAQRSPLWLALCFVLIAGGLFFLLKGAEQLVTPAQQFLFPVGFALLIAGLVTLWLAMKHGMLSADAGDDPWFYPCFAGLLALVGMTLAYAWLGMWPIGDRSAMIVDMHHQYAPLLAQLKKMIVSGDSALYTFEVGLGASFLPLFGYYLASPFNLLLLLFPDSLLCEAILVITLLKNMLTAALMTAALQYIYGKRTAALPLVSVMFSMSAYLIAYSWNIMWLDCVMLLPLVIWGFEKLMREGKYPLYALSLAALLYCNYYIGFMCCIFLVLYYLAYLFRERRGWQDNLLSVVRFGLGSLIGGLISFALLLPVAAALGTTSAAGGTFREMDTMFPLFDLFKQLLFGTVPTIRSGNLPNLYCGIFTVVLVPLFATTKTIPLRRRLAYLGLLALVGLSTTVNNADLFWHGMHSPNDLPYRYSFLFSFVLVLLAYEALVHVKDITPKQIGATAAGLIALLALTQVTTEKELTFLSLYVSLGLIAVYAVLTYLVAHRKTAAEIGYVLLLAAVMVEMVANANATFVQLNNNEYFTAHSAYVDNSITEATRQVVDKMQQWDEEETGADFYRMEFIPRRTCVDTALYHYAGVTVFASSNSYNETRLMGGLGFAVNGVNSHLYHSFNPVADSVLGIRYLASSTELDTLEKIDTITHEGCTYHIYRNPNALPLGFVTNEAVKEWTYSYYNPILTQNEMLQAMTNNGQKVFRLQTIESETASINGTSNFSISGGTNTFTCKIQERGNVFLFADCRAADSISVSVADPEGDNSQNWSVTTHEPYLINAGIRDVGDRVEVRIRADSSCTGNVYVAILDDAAYAQAMADLADEGMHVTAGESNKMTAIVSAKQNGTVFTSIPYDEGWTVKVDGIEVETFALGEAMLGFDVAAGEHTVTLTFRPRGLTAGILCSVAGILLLAALCVLQRWQRKKALAVSSETKTEETGDIPQEAADKTPAEEENQNLPPPTETEE